MDNVTNINFFEQDGSIIIPTIETTDRDFYVFATDFSQDGPEEVLKINSFEEFQRYFGDAVSSVVRELVNNAFGQGWGVIFKRVVLPTASHATGIFNKVINKFTSVYDPLQTSSTNLTTYKYKQSTASFEPSILPSVFNSNNNLSIAIVDNINLDETNIYTNWDHIKENIRHAIVDGVKNKNVVIRITESAGKKFLNIYVLAPNFNLTVPMPINVVFSGSNIVGGYVNGNITYRAGAYTLTNSHVISPTSYPSTSSAFQNSIVTLNVNAPTGVVNRFVFYKIVGANKYKFETVDNKLIDYGTGLYASDNPSANNGQIQEFLNDTNLFTISPQVVSTTGSPLPSGTYNFYISVELANAPKVSKKFKFENVSVGANQTVNFQLQNLSTNTLLLQVTVYSQSGLTVNKATYNANVNGLQTINLEYSVPSTSWTPITSFDEWIEVPNYQNISVSGALASVSLGGKFTLPTSSPFIRYKYAIVPFVEVKNNNSGASAIYYGKATEIPNVSITSNGQKVVLRWTSVDTTTWSSFTPSINTNDYTVKKGYAIYRGLMDGVYDKRLLLTNENLSEFIDYGDDIWQLVQTIQQTNVNYLTMIVSEDPDFDNPNNVFFVRITDVTNLDNSGQPMVYGIRAKTTNKTQRFNEAIVRFRTIYDKVQGFYNIFYINHLNEETKILEARKDGNNWVFKFVPKNTTVSYGSSQWSQFIDDIYNHILNFSKNYYIPVSDIEAAFDYFVESDGRLNLFGGRSRVEEEVSTPTQHISTSYSRFQGGNSGIPSDTREENLYNELLLYYYANSGSQLNYLTTELNKTNLYRNLLFVYVPYANSRYYWDTANHPLYQTMFNMLFSAFRSLAETRTDLFVLVDTPPISDYNQLETFNSLLGNPNTSFVAVYTPSVIRNNRRVSVGLEVAKKIILLINAGTASLAPYGISNAGVIEADNVEKTFTGQEYDKIYNILQYNPIIDFGSDGIQIRGLRTLYKAISALQNLHTRILASIIKKRLYRIALRYQGQQLNANTIASIITEINAYFIGLVEKQQIDSFDPVRNISSPSDLLQGILQLQISLKFTKQLEKINFYVTFNNTDIQIS